jgi:phage gpG-like protein
MAGVPAMGNPGMSIAIDIDPNPVILVAQFDKLSLDIRSFKEPLERSVRQVVIPSIKENFDAEGRPDTWEELTPETIMMRDYEGYPEGPILERSGRLRKAATALARWRFTREEAVGGEEWPGTAWYAPLHDQGFSTTHVEVPARPFMLIHLEDEDRIEEVFYEWFAERCLAAGFMPGTETFL